MLQKVVRSAIIDWPIGRVWAVLRDFNSHERWHNVVASSRIEGGLPPTRVGCVRSFRLRDGNHIREQLLGLSDSDHTSTYCIVDATVPLQRYVATVTLRPVTDGDRTFWHWESSFATPPGQERALREMVANSVYEAGFESFRQYLRAGEDLHAAGTPPAAALAATSGAPMPSRQIRVTRFGGPEQLEPAQAIAPGPGPREVRIQQRAIGVNFLDVYLRRGWIPDMLPSPGVPGMEAAGTVLDVGSDVGGLFPGDRVAYLCPAPGAYCSVRTLATDHVVRLPDAVPVETAAALLLKGVTADYLLRDLGRVQAGMRVLVHAAAGGLGLLVCAWARSMGAHVVGTVSSEAKARVARDHGCDHVIVSADYRFADHVKSHCGGADVLIDGLGQAAREQNMEALARCGHWISVGQATGLLQPLAADWLGAKSVTFSRPAVFDYVATHDKLSERAARVWAALADGSIGTPVIEQFTLDAASRAHERLESRASVGSLILIA